MLNKNSFGNGSTTSFLSPFKICYHTDRIGQWLDSGYSMPISATFDMTHKCSHSCPGCPYRHHKVDECFNNWKNVSFALEQLSNAGVRGVLFSGGGEPLDNPLTPEALMYARKLGMNAALITNGQGLNQSFMPDLLMCCDWIRISIDAASGPVYSQMHGVKGDYLNDTLDKVQILVENKRSLDSKTTLGISMLTNHITISEMVEFTRLAVNLDVDYCQFRPMQNPTTRDIDAHKIHFKSSADHCFKIAKSKIRLSFGNKYSRILNGHSANDAQCLAPHFILSVGADAKVYLCCHHRYESEFVTTNILEKNWMQKRNEYLDTHLPSLDRCTCPTLCKYHDLNIFLTGITRSKEHVNFL